MRNENDVQPIELIREGTILVTRRSRVGSLYSDMFLKMVHMGIVTKENGGFLVYDLHPDNKNNKEGCLEKKEFNEYMKGRNLIGIHHTGASSERIKKIAQKSWTHKYDKYAFNCQRFIDDVTFKEFSSDLYSYYAGIALASTGLLGLTAIIMYMIKNRK